MTQDSLEQLFSEVKPGDAGVMGDPIAHSLSPLMQNAAFQTWWGAFRDRDEPTPTYHKFHVRPNQLKQAFELAQKYKLRGFNLTVPHKVAGCEYVQKVDKFAKKVGAINTVSIQNGEVLGFNTDGQGFRRCLEEDLDFIPEGKKALVIGAGGTGRVLAYQLVELGAEVFWWNRNEKRLKENLMSLKLSDKKLQGVFTPSDIKEKSQDVDLIVNATSVGLSPEDGMPVPGLKFKPTHTVFDVVYNRKTRFIQEAEAVGAQSAQGLGMLVYQGARAFEIWTNAPAPKEVMWSALTKSINQGQN